MVVNGGDLVEKNQLSLFIDVIYLYVYYLFRPLSRLSLAFFFFLDVDTSCFHPATIPASFELGMLSFLCETD